MLFKCLGVIMRKTTKKEFISTHLEMVYKAVDHSIQIEREVDLSPVDTYLM